MSRTEVVRAWKDPRFRAALPPADRSRLPDSPAGIVEVPEIRLDIAGGADAACISAACTAGCDSFGCSFYQCVVQ